VRAALARAEISIVAFFIAFNVAPRVGVTDDFTPIERAQPQKSMSMKIQSQQSVKWCIAHIALCVVISGVASIGHAESIMKMSLGGSGSNNMQFASSKFALLSDGLDSPGDRNMTIDSVLTSAQSLPAFAGSGSASISLSGMMAEASPTNSGQLVIQSFNLGALAIYGADDSLLLSASLSLSAIQGALGPSDAQALFLGFGEVTGGSMKKFVDPDSLQVRIKYPTIEGGFEILSSPTALKDFATYTSSVEILATQVIPVPEPAIAGWLAIVVSALISARRRRHI